MTGIWPSQRQEAAVAALQAGRFTPRQRPVPDGSIPRQIRGRAVSLYTGVPEISIALFAVRGRTLELPIVLTYHAGGIEVEELASWAGIGWTVEAGLDRGIREGAEFVLSTQRSKMAKGSDLAKEVAYLEQHGYTWADDNVSLIPK